MHWEELPETLDCWTERCAAPSWDLRQKAANCYTGGEVGYYFHPVRQVAALCCEGVVLPGDHETCYKMACAALGEDMVQRPALTLVQAVSGEWVKIAYSPTLRRMGEALNFFPGTYPGGIPNHASPLAAMLTSSLVGAGLGYGAGTLGEKLLPERWDRGKLRRTLAVLGGLGGAAMASPLAVMSHIEGKPLTDPWPFHEPLPPQEQPIGWAPVAGPPLKLVNKEGADLPEIGQRCRTAMAAVSKRAEEFSSFGYASQMPRSMTPLDVNVDALGRTLWDAGANPAVMGKTMGVMYAAQQLPSGRAQPGWVTADQFSQLAWNAGMGAAKGAITGALVGAVLNQTIGMPTRGIIPAGAALGVISAVVPKLLGG